MYVRIALRLLKRHFEYTAINIVGFVVCISCSLLILVFMRHELSYDAFHEHADNIYRITATAKYGDNEVPVYAPGLLGPSLVSTQPGVANQVRIRCMSEPVMIRLGTERFQETEKCYADPTLFDIFDFSLRSGNAGSALSNPNSIILSERLANKYFGEQDAVGQVLEIDGQYLYEVTGIFDKSDGPSHLRIELLLSLASLSAIDPLIDSWADGGANPYVLLEPGYSGEELHAYLNAHLSDLMGHFAMGGLKAHIEPLREIYHSSGHVYDGELRGNMQYVYLFAFVALLLIVIASINYINMATAKGISRGREVGVRKSMGASKKQLMYQFLGESGVICYISMIIAFVVAAIVLPSFGALIERTIEVNALLNIPVVVISILLVGGIVLIAGSYPAFYLSAFDPVRVLKGKSVSSRGAVRIRQCLLIAQCTLSIILACCTILLWNQLHFMRSQNLGFDRENVVLITPTEEMNGQYAAIKREILSRPGVTGVSTAQLPGYDYVIKSTHEIEGYESEAGRLPYIDTFDIDHDFVELLDVNLLAGRNFDIERRGDQFNSVLINRAALPLFGVTKAEDALGKWVKRKYKSDGVWTDYTFYVAGVLDDFYSWSMRRAVTPIFFYLTEDEVKRFGKIVVKMEAGNVSETLAELEAAWFIMAPGRPFNFSFLDQEIDQFYKIDIQQGKLLSIFSALSVIVACLGLLGMVAFMLMQRRKEIGIRKVLGAGVRDILAMLCKEYVILVGIAFAIAVPISFVSIRHWLSQFAYSAGIGWATIVFVGISALFLTLITVSYQSIRAAQSDPVHVLKQD